MKFWACVTDNEWFSFLSRENPDEVNFWNPGGRPLAGDCPVGALFLFKLKRPNNHFAGGGYFVKFSRLPLSIAWEAFGRKNGAPDRATFERLIRPLTPNPRERDPEIGCTILTSPFFWPKDAWMNVPDDWRSVVRVRSYDSEAELGARIFDSVRLQVADLPIAAEEDQRYGSPRQYHPRLGQGAFRVLVTDAYHRRCALTGEKTLPALEAAHIKPYAEGGPHELGNSLLLRSDFHRLFDSGLVTVTPDLRVEVSQRIKEQWFNGKAYYRLHGEPLASLPSDPRDRPSMEFLAWHNENCFQ